MSTTTSTSAQPAVVTPPADHAACENCPRVICSCPDALCQGYADIACDHGRSLCDSCRPACGGCRDDAREDSAGSGSSVVWVPVPLEETVPEDGDQIVCVACDGDGGVRAYPEEPNPAFQWDACRVCGGVGSVPFAAVMAGAA